MAFLKDMAQHSITKMSKRHLLPGFIPNIITVYAQIVGPKDTKTIKVVLDTGASYTMIPVRKAIEIGYDPSLIDKKIEIFTASGIEYVPKITIASLKCLGKEVKNIEVVCHELPPQAPVDGLLGLNFLVHLPAFIEFYQKIRLA